MNKLAEIMNRKDMKLDQKKKGSTADLRKKEKENRKLQLELNQEKEKFNHMAIKYQKELNEMQAVGSEGHAMLEPGEIKHRLLDHFFMAFITNSNWRRNARIATSSRCSWTARRATSSSSGRNSTTCSSAWRTPASPACRRTRRTAM